MKMSEEQLCLAFAEHVKNSPEFCSWILNRTKFKRYASSVRLLHEEQMSLRPRKFWWKHWWCEFPGQRKKGGEIDIFMVFEIADGKRFALHIENKIGSGIFEDGQPEGYRIRAQHMASKQEYLGYEDFETILIAPFAFRSRCGGMCDLFDLYVSHEDIAKFVPEFRTN